MPITDSVINVCYHPFLICHLEWQVLSEYNKDFSITVRFQENKAEVTFVYHHPQWIVI